MRYIITHQRYYHVITRADYLPFSEIDRPEKSFVFRTKEAMEEFHEKLLKVRAMEQIIEELKDQ